VPAAHTVIDGRIVVITSDGTPAAPTATTRSAAPLGGQAEAGRLLAAPECRALLDALTPGSAVGVSAPHDRLDDAPEAYRQALAASRAAVADPAVGPVAVWPSIGVYRFFAAPGEQTGPLELLKARDPRGVLAATLEVYLDSGGDAQATAEATHLHRTSLYYRLRRIEEITGRDLRDGHHRLELHLALKSARWAATA
jgi:DNA-binding PucR family transcriptional regulator